MNPACGVCGCTETNACLVGCAWADDDIAALFGCEQLCDLCAEMLMMLANYRRVVRNFNVVRLARALRACPPVDSAEIIRGHEALIVLTGTDEDGPALYDRSANAGGGAFG